MLNGVVYVIKNPFFKGLVKVGRTENYKKRTISLNSPGTPEDFELLFAYELPNYKSVEKMVHHAYAAWRHHSESGRLTEFFDERVTDGVKAILSWIPGSVDVTNNLIKRRETEWVDLSVLADKSKPRDKNSFQKKMWSLKANVKSYCERRGMTLMRDPSNRRFMYPRDVVEKKVGTTIEKWLKVISR
jgi:hypothetical protein